MSIDHAISDADSTAPDALDLRDADLTVPSELPGDELDGTAAAALLRPVSGLYRRTTGILFRRDELRLDVDRLDPQMTASGVVRGVANQPVHWIASLTSAGPNAWTGAIWYKDGPAVLAHTAVRIRTSGTLFGPTIARVTFHGAGQPLVHEYLFAGASFDPVEFELDATPDANPVYSIQTHAHPNRPGDLPNETLTVQAAFRRAGFAVTTTPNGPLVPTQGAGVDARWSDTEMHDAMQAHWSRFDNRPQWSLWVFHAALHEQGNGLGGVMFDDIGPNHRQGTAIFTESFISQPEPNDPAPAAGIARMRFWTMCHEMGHAFNLAHSWQKSLGAPFGSPWLANLQDEPEARSFMNYPYNVAGGLTAFFQDFRYRFSDQELLFLRHAPRRFVQMGNAAWFDNHGFQEANVSPEPAFELVVRLNRSEAELEFLEPAMIEIKATNATRQPVVVDAQMLADDGRVTIVVKRDNSPARIWRPFATACVAPDRVALAPGESLYRPVSVGAGLGGWTVEEPGWYTIQASLRLDTGEDVVSNALRLRVAPPRDYDEERLAQDLFSDDVARTLAFNGTRELGAANDTLREAAERLPDRQIATHAEVAVGMPLRRSGKIVTDDDGEGAITAVPARPDEANALLRKGLLTQPDAAADTLGHITYRSHTEAYARFVAAQGDPVEAGEVLTGLGETLGNRSVKPSVLAEISALADDLGDAAGRSRKSGKANGARRTGRKGD